MPTRKTTPPEEAKKPAEKKPAVKRTEKPATKSAAKPAAKRTTKKEDKGAVKAVLTVQKNDNPKPSKPRPKSPLTGAELPIGRPFEQGSEQRERARQAGIKSGEARRHRRTLREDMLTALEAITKDKDGNEHTRQESITLALLAKALRGDVRAYEAVRDTIGEKQAERVDMAVSLPKFENLDAAFAKLGGSD